MPPSASAILARRFGQTLGLTEGLNGAATPLQASPTVCEDLNKLETDVWEIPHNQNSFDDNVQALYLPSLYRTLIDNTAASFDAVHPNLLGAYVNRLRNHVASPIAFRFIREHPDDVTALRSKLLELIAHVYEQSRTSDSDASGTIYALIEVYNALTERDRTREDEAGTQDLLRISSALRTRLRELFPNLAPDAGQIRSKVENGFHANHNDMFTAALYPEKYQLLRGSALIKKNIADSECAGWWICENQRFGRVSGCERVPRDELKVCARCLAVRYCSTEHQTLDWEKHKLSCIKPTW